MKRDIWITIELTAALVIVAASYFMSDHVFGSLIGGCGGFLIGSRLADLVGPHCK